MTSRRYRRHCITGRGPRLTPTLAGSVVTLAELTCCAGVLLGCSAREDVAGILFSEGTLEADLGGAGATATDAGAGTEGSPDQTGALTVVGHPLRSTHWPDPLAAWPLSASLAEFFARAGQREPVRVEGADGELLRELWQAVERGEYGSRRNVVGVVDRVDERYLLVFQEP